MEKLIIGRKKAPKERREIVSRRTRFIKHFENEDGTVEAVISPVPVHYLNSQTNRYEEVGKEFEKKGDKIVVRGKGIQLSVNEINVELSKDDHKLSFTCPDFQHSPAKCYGDKVVYTGSQYNLEYLLNDSGIKENIVVKEKQKKYEYSFTLMSKLACHVSDNQFEFCDETGEVQFSIPSPVMIDADGTSSDLVDFELTRVDEEKLILKITADAEWINEHSFPVRIDPQVNLNDSIVTHYAVTDSVITTVNPTAMKIGDAIRRAETTKYGHLICLNVQEFKTLLYSNVALKFNYESTITRSMQVGYVTGALIKPNLNVGYSIESFARSSIYSGSLTNDLLVTIKNSLQEAISDFRQHCFIYIESATPKTATTTTLPLTIVTIPAPDPQHYIDLQKEVVVEQIRPSYIDLNIARDDLGVLTTYSKNEQIWQRFQVNNSLYLREAESPTAWRKWKQANTDFSFNDGVLAISQWEDE